MSFDRQAGSRWRSVRVPLRVVNRVYGNDEVDTAGDDMVAALRQLSAWPDQYRARFSLDTAHPNSWYHSIVFEVENLPEPLYTQFVAALTSLGLVADGG